VKRIDDQIADLRRGIDEDIREALLNLDSAAEQVAVAREGQELAQRELATGAGSLSGGHGQQCRGGHRAGRAGPRRRELHSCRFSHVDAKFALARAHGRYGEKHS
jgi:hypothetical protein